MKLAPSFTTISTIAIETGQSQLVVSVLRSGARVHLQLVQAQPGLCEIGWNQEQNQKLIQEQQQLIHRLQKHESEALSLVMKSLQTEQRTEEEEAELKEALGASLSEGWSLLLQLLHRQQEVLMTASDFYRRALEFDVSINQLENLLMRPDQVRLRFDSVRKDVLIKSLRVLNSSSVLLDKVHQLQSTAPLQQEGDGACEAVSQLVERLQDRRRRVDWAVRLHLQQAEDRVQSPGSGSELRPELTRPPDWTLILDQNLESELTPAEGTHLHLPPSPEESRDLQTGSRSSPTPESSTDQRSGVILGLSPGSRSDRQSGSKFEGTRKLESGSRSKSTKDEDLQAESSSEETRTIGPGSRSEEPESGSDAELSKRPNRQEAENSHAHQAPPANQPQDLLSSCEHLVDKLCVWLQHSSSVLSHSSEAGWSLTEAEAALNTHVQLHTQAESACQDAENLKQILDRVRALQTGPGAGPQPGPLAARADAALAQLQGVNGTIGSNLRLLRTHVLFLRAAQQVEAELEEGRKVCRRVEEEEEAADGSPPQKESRSREETLRRLLAVQEVGNSFVRMVATASGSLDVHAVASVVQWTIERLNRIKQEVDEQRLCKEQEVTSHKLLKALQDLRSVSELLDSCTSVDLGSELQTATLTHRFRQATPLFSQLDAEVEEVVRSRRRLRGDQEEVEEVLRLQRKVKQQLQQNERILDLSGSFHLRARELEALTLSDAKRAHKKQQLIQSLFTAAAALRSNICTAAAHSDGAGFKLQQLERRLLSLDSLRQSWLNEAVRREEEALRRERVNQQIKADITQLCDSFKDLKKGFNNLKFSFLKRSVRSRDVKAARNQLQQVELFEDRLEVLRPQSLLRRRLQGLRAQLGRGGVAREVEDAINELQRQMGELERSVGGHRKTLDMTCRLHQAMEEYQFWCEEASATIARVQMFSSGCRSTEAVGALYRQFEKFVRPTVPEQEERISQICDLAARLHGAEEGWRCAERTVSKHWQMVAAIRQLSDGLMEREAELKKEEEETEKKLKKTEWVDPGVSQEDTCELKETGHTPEPTCRSEAPVKAAANQKPPFQEISHRQTPSSASCCSTHSFTPLQLSSTDAQTTPPHPVTGPTFADLQRAWPRKEDALDLSEAELPQQEALSEDSLSNDKYECASPDDISLPPLAETPESSFVQSDCEEGSNQPSLHTAPPAGQSGTGAEQVQQSGSRFRSETSSGVQSPVSIPAPGLQASVKAHFISSSNQVHTSRTTERSCSEPCSEPVQSPALQPRCCPQPLDCPDTDTHEDTKDTGLLRGRTLCQGNGFSQDANFTQTTNQICSVSRAENHSPTSTSPVVPQSSHLDTFHQSSSSPTYRRPSLIPQDTGACVHTDTRPQSVPEHPTPPRKDPSSGTTPQSRGPTSMSTVTQRPTQPSESQTGPPGVHSVPRSLTQCVRVPAPPPPPPLLTSDPAICQPVAVREEIKLSPQIRGSPPPVPPLPPAPPCSTRPVTRASELQGSPVTLEVEVTGHPEPRLTWSEGGDSSPGRDAGGGSCAAVGRQDWQRSADVRWLVAEVWDAIRAKWLTWLGTLSVLLWLLLLVLL